MSKLNYFEAFTQPYSCFIIFNQMLIAMLKRLVWVMLVFFVTACTLDSGVESHFEVLPIESFEVPNEFVHGETYEILIRFYQPSDCHFFSGIFWQRDHNVRVVGAQSIVERRNNCVDLDKSEEHLLTRSFHFHVTHNHPYIFRFYKGLDEEGNHMFEEIEIPVAD